LAARESPEIRRASPASTSAAPAQTYTPIYNFTDGADGANPLAGVTLDRQAGLYGTTSAGGRRGFGNVFGLTHTGSNWNFHLLYTFLGEFQEDGTQPYARVVIGPDGALYGTTYLGGDGDACPARYGCGIVYQIKPKARASLDPWQETVLYRFGGDGGSNPAYGDLTFDGAGNIYGTTQNGGTYQQGAVFELVRNGDSWTENILYSFAGAPDGGAPLGGVIFDAAGNLYGTTSAGGSGGGGTIYQLHPSASGWTESVLYSFQIGPGGEYPASAVTSNLSGMLFGATQSGGTDGGGALFELIPNLTGTWSFAALFDFNGPTLAGAYRTLIMDGAGNFYGTTSNDGPSQQGSVFKLTSSNGVWTYTPLHSFTGGMDGGLPYGTLSLDANGNLYGTAFSGGAYGYGVVFEITP
jgi:uncharacterized repeat protein (TIGR03803 family)